MKTRERTELELMELYLRALATGLVTRADLLPPPDRAKLDAAWRWVLRAVKPGPADPKLLPVVEGLLELDPGFPAGQLLRGLALQKLGRTAEAQEAFLAQSASPNGVYSTAARTLAELRAA